MRQWWFTEERDMPIGKVIAGADFGTAIHAVNERWRRADDRGNGPDLYPPGWNAGLDQADSALVKLLHEKAVESGVLVRRAGRKPEEWMNTPIIVDDDVVQLTGKLDCIDLEGFEDDKSTKVEKWAKDEEGLASDSAMLFYANEWCRRHGEAVKVRMRYNYFLKDPSHPKTWPVEAFVTREVVDHFRENELMPTVRAMVAVANQKLTDEQWEQVAGPSSQDACRAFGGCPFATMCGRIEQPAQYRARIARVLSNRTKESPVGIFSKSPAAPAPTPTPPAPSTPAPTPTPVAAPAAATARGGIFARRNSTPPAAPATPTTPAAVVQAPTPPPAAPKTVVVAKPELPAKSSEPKPGAAPWAYPDCRACKGTGIHPTEKRPCKGCRTTRIVQKLVTDEAFDISYDAQGNLQWVEKGHEGQPDSQGTIPAIATVTTPTQAPVPTITEPVVKPERKPRAKKAAEVAADVQPTTATVDPAPTVSLSINGDVIVGGVPAKGHVVLNGKEIQAEAKDAGLPLIILAGAFPEKLPAYYSAVSMADLFAQVAAQVGETLGKNFFDINAFERRDLLTKLAGNIAEKLKATVLVCSRSTPDVDALVQALKPHAGFVLVGLN